MKKVTVYMHDNSRKSFPFTKEGVTEALKLSSSQGTEVSITGAVHVSGSKMFYPPRRWSVDDVQVFMSGKDPRCFESTTLWQNIDEWKKNNE